MFQISPELAQNFTLAAIFWVFYGLYFPLNWWQKRRSINRCIAWHWDKKMPYSELFYLPYILGLATTIAGPWILAFFATPAQFGWLILALTFVLTVSYLCWIFYPCKIIKSPTVTKKKHSWIIRSLLGYGAKYGDYNSFPSAHVSLVTTMCLWLLLVFPEFTVVWLTLMFFNFLSVLLTHQHYIADALAGLGLAGFIFYISYLMQSRI